MVSHLGREKRPGKFFRKYLKLLCSAVEVVALLPLFVFSLYTPVTHHEYPFGQGRRTGGAQVQALTPLPPGPPFPLSGAKMFERSHRTSQNV